MCSVNANFRLELTRISKSQKRSWQGLASISLGCQMFIFPRGFICSSLSLRANGILKKRGDSPCAETPQALEAALGSILVVRGRQVESVLACAFSITTGNTDFLKYRQK